MTPTAAQGVVRSALLLVLFVVVPVARAATTPEPFHREPIEVSELELRMPEGFPLRVAVVMRGDLPDACSSVESVEQRFVPADRTYDLSVVGVRPADALCAQVPTPFEIQVPIVKAGIASGEFTVRAGEISAGFEIRPLGEFPGFEVPSTEKTVWVCFVEPGLCFSPPTEWRRDELRPIWIGPEYLSARLGGRFHARESNEIETLLPASAEVHDSTPAHLAGTIGTRFAVSRDELWSEHLFGPCGEDLWCELWLEAPSEPLLDAAGEAFWRLVRFAIRF